jgi:hypothetical protein
MPPESKERPRQPRTNLSQVVFIRPFNSRLPPDSCNTFNVSQNRLYLSTVADHYVPCLNIYPSRFPPLTSNHSVFRPWRMRASVTISNRRVRTRTHGGVAGVSGQPLPLCRSNGITGMWLQRLVVRQKAPRSSQVSQVSRGKPTVSVMVPRFDLIGGRACSVAGSLDWHPAPSSPPHPIHRCYTDHAYPTQFAICS